MAINVNEVNAALELIEVNKGISREVVLAALKESMMKAFRKTLGADDALVGVDIDLDNGIFDMYQIKNVVEDVQDDLLEISVEDANEEGDKKYAVGDEYRIYVDVNELRKAMVLTIKGLMKQKFAEAEKEVLHEQFKDKINTLITGRVEQYDERGATINIGKASVYLPRKEMIKDERFAVGDNIKLFVSDVASGSKGGAHIVVSRANEGFLKAIMSEEIHDIYDGTIEIVSAAREAGERSKVAVTSKDVNVDPAGACIGPNGNRIQKVVSQLGNASSKEKIDIISYKENAGLYIMEALKPAHVVGIKLDEENKSAIVIVRDDSLSLAIGKKGVNARLAVKLTGYKIDIKVESDALSEGIEYTSFEELSALDQKEHEAKVAEAARESLVYQGEYNSSLPGLPEGYVAPQERGYENDQNELDKALEEEVENEEIESSIVEEVSEPVEEVKEDKVEEEKPVETPITTVKTTTTLEDLEKSLEDESSKSNKKSSNYKRKKKVEEEKEEDKAIKHADTPRMSIYTEEELAEMEAEEALEDDYVEDEVDYDEYDDYYEDK